MYTNEPEVGTTPSVHEVDALIATRRAFETLRVVIESDTEVAVESARLLGSFFNNCRADLKLTDYCSAIGGIERNRSAF